MCLESLRKLEPELLDCLMNEIDWGTDCIIERLDALARLAKNQYIGEFHNVIDYMTLNGISLNNYNIEAIEDGWRCNVKDIFKTDGPLYIEHDGMLYFFD